MALRATFFILLYSTGLPETDRVPSPDRRERKRAAQQAQGNEDLRPSGSR